MSGLLPEAELLIEKHIRSRFWNVLSVAAPVIGVLALLVSWAVMATSKSLAEAAVNKTLDTNKTRIENMEKEIQRIRTSAQEQLVSFNRDLGKAEADITRAGMQVGALEDATKNARARLNASIREIERELSKAESVVKASGNISDIANKLAKDPSFNETVRGTLLDVPIGSIIAWHRNPAASPGVPGPALGLRKGWMECNGGELPSDSPLHKIGASRTPNLNDPKQPNFLGNEFGGAFLRGGGTSGGKQMDSFKEHTHADSSDWRYLRRKHPGGKAQLGTGGSEKFAWKDAVTPEGEDETRPVNMSVVWIIRVK